ncbi:rhythmically expressed gene 2 protein [Harpegnathos saltator]|uniref:rhythmically expressed gene 2 protein n=1 Tax=Harpegnathos saltator TaxID=610380 RepID=UPI00058ED2F2|nr:rhythmically expressed gene 2 protein [Harpegnathos saltator]XP_025157432.1 rhythmically expressed gene 2 protein [Harpegnathos saltator]
MIPRVRPRLVTFDVTGTLLMTKLEHYVDIGRQYGLHVDSLRLARNFKSNFVRLTAEHPNFGRHTGLGWENWWRTIVHEVFKDQHPFVSQDTLNKVADSLISCYATARCWHTYPGAVELLSFLRSKGIFLGVISNFDQRLESILEDTRIREYFVFVLTSYDFGMEKPSLPIFNEALRLTTLSGKEKILPQEAMHIGDTVDNDYFGAKSASWNALLIKHNEGEKINDKIPKEDVFNNLKELQCYFEKVLASDHVTT